MHLPAPTFRQIGSIADADLQKFNAVVLLASKNEEEVELASNSFTEKTLN